MPIGTRPGFTPADPALPVSPPGRGGSSRLGGPLGDLDDELGLSDLSDLLFGLSKLAVEAQRPNAHKLLSKIFLTRVKLQAPPAGPAAVRHGQRLQRDAAEEAEVGALWGGAAMAGWVGGFLEAWQVGVSSPRASAQLLRVLRWQGCSIAAQPASWPASITASIMAQPVSTLPP